MEINTEQLESLRKRAVQYSVAAFGRGEPDCIKLDLDGRLSAVWRTYDRDEDDIEEEFAAELLSADPEVVYFERKEREEAERLKREEYRKEQTRIQEEWQKTQRKEQYLKLKKEFEP